MATSTLLCHRRLQFVRSDENSTRIAALEQRNRRKFESEKGIWFHSQEEEGTYTLAAVVVDGLCVRRGIPLAEPYI